MEDKESELNKKIDEMAEKIKKIKNKEKEYIIVKRVVRKLVHQRGIKISEDGLNGFNQTVENLLEAAMDRAMMNARKTVLGKDF
jgi:histone H3/H4